MLKRLKARQGTKQPGRHVALAAKIRRFVMRDASTALNRAPLVADNSTVAADSLADFRQDSENERQHAQACENVRTAPSALESLKPTE